MNIQSKKANAKESASSLSDKEKQFIEQYAALLAPRGLSPSAGRVYAYLLLRQAPVSVDQISIDLEMSRVGAWNSVRNLETSEHVSRHSVPGSKRALYSSSKNFGAPLLKQATLLGEMSTLLGDFAENNAVGGVATELQDRASFYLAIQRVMQEEIASLNAGRAREPK